MPSTSFTQVQEGILLGNWQNDDLPIMAFGRYNEVWGVVVNGEEYAVIGSTNGTHFLSLDPVDGMLEEVAFVAGAAQGSSIIHRDFHSYGNYLYAVADEGNSSLQIIDFSGLPNAVQVVYDDNEFINQAHNIFIDEANARLYCTNEVILSLANPEQPTLLDKGAFGGHDIFVRDNILFANLGNDGMIVMDYTDVNNPITLGTLTDYNNSGYNHSGWMSEDGRHYFLCDETSGALVKSVYISDYNNMKVVDFFKSDNQNPNHIAHNAMVRDNLLYVSYYSDGIQIFDVTDPEKVVRKYFYDTFPGVNNSGFKGAWGVYALLPSGRILVSDMSSGLYLMEFPADQTVFALESELSGCINEALIFEVLIGADFATSGANLSIDGLPVGTTVSYSENPAAPNAIVEVTVTDITMAGNFDLIIMAEDSSSNASTNIALEILSLPQPFSLDFPADASTDVVLNPVFSWGVNAGTPSNLEITTDPNFNNVNVFSEFLTDNSFALPFELETNTTYYWRVVQDGACGNFISEVFSFTGLLDGVFKTMEASISIYPNPVGEELVVETGDYFQGDLKIELFNLDGKLMNYWSLFNSNPQFSLTPAHDIEGLYLLRISSNENTLTKKVLFKK